MSAVGMDSDVPLCVSCEHALLKTNIFQEALFLLVKRNPLHIFLLPIWFLRGRSALIQQVSEEVQINWRTVPLPICRSARRAAFSYFAVFPILTIARGIVKRWPRLAEPELISTGLSWVLFATGAFKFQSGGALNGSRWLAMLAIPDSYPHASLSRAVSQGLLTFFKGTYTFNSVLWTMQPEFIGSIIAFELALLMPR
jgi:hypothetical protein